jgi:hypothetical protein
MPEASRPVVFAGPSLPRRPDAAWQALLGRCDLRPPAQRGDLLGVLALRPATLVLLDGYYFNVPSVPHKEILYALDAGIRVIGAASLGALRAAELADLGMTGIGKVFTWYRTGIVDGDDEVALLHAPAEHGYRALTTALVELRHAVDLLAASGAIRPADGQRLIAEVKALSFLDRHLARIEELAAEIAGDSAARELARLVEAGGLKQGDARQALELALALENPEDPEDPAAVAPRTRTATGYLNFYKESYLRCPPGRPESPSLQKAWRMAQLFHPGAPAFVREIRQRALLAAAAARTGTPPPPEDVERRIGEMRDLHRGLFGEAFLPDPEYAEEARFEALAAEARRRFGPLPDAAAPLAQAFGLPGTGFESLLCLTTGGPESVPAWWLVRAFTFRPAFRPALETAASAAEVHRCFLRWADGARVLEEDLHHLAAGLWDCSPDQVTQEAARRWLFVSSSLSEGLRETLELIAAAERLPRPINDYPEKRDILRGACLLEML